MLLSAEGAVSLSLTEIKDANKNREGDRVIPLSTAKMTLEAFHDILLGVALGKADGKDVAKFLWSDDLDKAEFISELVKFK